MSAEVVRANPGNYATSLRTYLAEAFAVAFDYAVFYDLGGDGTGTSPFTDPINSTTKAVALGTTTQANGGIHGDLVAGM
jgi:HK97 family phage major capsid protein